MNEEMDDAEISSAGSNKKVEKKRNMNKTRLCLQDAAERLSDNNF